MAISSNFYSDDYDLQRQQYEQEVQKQRFFQQMQAVHNGQLGRALGDYAGEQKQAPKPVPQPEPNKVLLLLGEEA